MKQFERKITQFEMHYPSFFPIVIAAERTVNVLVLVLHVIEG